MDCTNVGNVYITIFISNVFLNINTHTMFADRTLYVISNDSELINIYK